MCTFYKIERWISPGAQAVNRGEVSKEDLFSRHRVIFLIGKDGETLAQPTLSILTVARSIPGVVILEKVRIPAILEAISAGAIGPVGTKKHSAFLMEIRHEE